MSQKMGSETVKTGSQHKDKPEPLIPHMIGRSLSADDLYAFVHIEKTAGTTLINIFKRIFAMNFVEVRPLADHAAVMWRRHLTRADLRTYTKLNPSIKCISGHSIYPSLLGSRRAEERIQYMTLLRDPVRRYVSHYTYICRHEHRKIPFEKFLTIERHQNLQVKKIAHSGGLDKAIEIISRDFLIVGIVEQFNEFLLMMHKKVFEADGTSIANLRLFGYRPANVSKNRDNQALITKYREEIIAINREDLAMYDFVKKEVLPAQRKWYGPELNSDLASFSAQNETWIETPPSIFSRLFRLAYFDGVSTLMRLKNGLPAKGGY